MHALVQNGYALNVEGELNQIQRQILNQECLAFQKHSDAHILRLDKEGDRFVLLSGKDKIAEHSSFDALIGEFLFPHRRAHLERKTNETHIQVRVNLDGRGVVENKTGLHFFDHMLDQLGKHAHFDLSTRCTGDLHVDEHHTIEDVAIAIGECLGKALGSKIGLERYGFAVPMDESLSWVSLDLSGRPYLEFEADFKREFVGDFPTEMAKHFFYSLAVALRASLNMKVSGENDHHKLEALFKGLALALRIAVSKNERIKSMIPSSKGLL